MKGKGGGVENEEGGRVREEMLRLGFMLMFVASICF